MKPLLIGEAPSKNEHPPTPLEGRIGRRLAACAGLSFEEFLERFDRVNLLDVRQDTKEKGFEFDMEKASKSARRMYWTLENGRTIILLGKRVAAAFALPSEYFQPLRWAPVDLTFYVVPHPSGVNRWWNDPANVEKMNAFMRGLLV